MPDSPAALVAEGGPGPFPDPQFSGNKLLATEEPLYLHVVLYRHRKFWEANPVICGTRIPAEHVTSLLRKGISESEILEDFRN